MHQSAQNSVDVLIVDDDAEQRVGLRRLLERAGYSCAEAVDGEEALLVARQSPPCVALVDLMMPKVDGLDTARALRSDPRTHRVHIHMISGYREPMFRRAATRAGCEVFLEKPLSFGDLLEAVSLAVCT
jgi:CheY-like chemotaxis protein